MARGLKIGTHILLLIYIYLILDFGLWAAGRVRCLKIATYGNDGEDEFVAEFWIFGCGGKGVANPFLGRSKSLAYFVLITVRSFRSRCIKNVFSIIARRL